MRRFPAAVTHPVRLLRGLVPRRQHHVASGAPGRGAAGRGGGGVDGRGAWAAGVLLRVVCVAAVRGPGAASQERVAVPAPGSRPGRSAAAALQAGAAPHRCRGDARAPAGCGGNHRCREGVRFGTAGGPRGVLLRGGGGGAARRRHGRRRGGRRRGDGGAREAFTLMLEQLFQPLAQTPHAHLTEGGALRLGRGPFQLGALRPPRPLFQFQDLNWGPAAWIAGRNRPIRHVPVLSVRRQRLRAG